MATPFEQISIQLFMPLRLPSIERRSAFENLCHYTSAAGFSDILASQQIWLSNVAVMNDHNEIFGGAKHLYECYITNKDSMFADIPNLREEILREFDALFVRIHLDTYAFCFSGHNSEDNLSGRLAMWRAYGSDGDGVCIVLDRDRLLRDDQADFPLYWTAMVYEKPDAFRERILAYLEYIDRLVKENVEEIRQADQSQVVWALVFSMMALALSHKHAGFSDEHEFRYIHLAGVLPMSRPEIQYKIARSGSKIKPVLSVPIKSYSDGQNELGGNLSELLKCVIVGPSEDRMVQQRAAKIALVEAGLPDVPVFYSEIPYRRIR